jgi:hypothetical protein
MARPACHPERSRTIREADRSAESKDPYTSCAIRPRQGVLTTNGAECDASLCEQRGLARR